MKRSRRRKAVVERALHVGREDRQAAIGLHALQQVVDLDVGVAVVAVLHLAALAEQRVGLVEEQDRAAVLGRVEQAAQILLGLADVLADDRRQVDAVEVEPQLVARAPRPPSSCPVPLSPANSALMPRPRFIFWREAPALVDGRALRAPGRRSAAAARSSASRQHEVVPGRLRLDARAPGHRAAAACVAQAGVPQPLVQRRRIASRRPARRARSRSIVARLRLNCAARRGRALRRGRAQRRDPGRRLLGRRRLARRRWRAAPLRSPGHGSARRRGTRRRRSRSQELRHAATAGPRAALRRVSARRGKRERQQQRSRAATGARSVSSSAALRRQQLGRQPVQLQSERGRDLAGDELLARRVGPEQLHDGRRAARAARCPAAGRSRRRVAAATAGSRRSGAGSRAAASSGSSRSSR